MANAAVISDAFLAHASRHFLADDQRQSFIEACRRPLRKSIRVNTLKISVQDFSHRCKQLGIQLIAIPWCPEGFWLVDNKTDSSLNEVPTEPSLGNLVEHLQGLFYIQEASSMLPPVALFAERNHSLHSKPLVHKSAQHPLKVLDLAAAPGSKTTQLSALMQNQGLLLANEIASSRVKSLHANLQRCGVVNCCLSQFDGRKLGERLAGQFDRVLLDAPCGGEGTIRKDPSALANWQLSKVEEMASLQKELILTAYQCLKPGGRLVYSTCTLSPEENQQVANFLLATTDALVSDLKNLFAGAEKAITKEGYLHIQPQTFDSEGFFVAAFSKPEPIEAIEPQQARKINPSKKRKSKSPVKWKSHFSLLEKKLVRQLIDYYQSHFGLQPEKIAGEFHQKDKQVWLLPEGSIELNQSVRLNRLGIKLAEIYPNKIRSHHEFIMGYGQFMEKQKVNLELKQVADFYKGKNLELSPSQLAEAQLKPGEVLLCYADFPVGLASLSQNKLKNLLPRELVKDSFILPSFINR